MARDTEKSKTYAAEWPLRHAMAGAKEHMPGLFHFERVRLALGALAEGMTDEQVKAYTLPVIGHAKSLATVERMVQWFWAGQYGHGNPDRHGGCAEAPPVVSKQRGGKSARYSAGKANRYTLQVTESDAGFELSTVAHETAHSVTYMGHQTGQCPFDPGHGRWFRAAHVHVCRHMLGDDVAESLRLCYEVNGLAIDKAFLEALSQQRLDNLRGSWGEVAKAEIAREAGRA